MVDNINLESSQREREATQAAADRLNLSRTLQRTLDETLGITRRRTLEETELLRLSKAVSQSASVNLEVSRKIRDLDKQKIKILKNQSDIQREINQISNLSSEEDLKFVNKIAELRNEANQKELKYNKVYLSFLQETNEEKKGEYKEQADNLRAQIDFNLEQANVLNELISEEGKRLTILEQQLALTEGQLTSIQDQEKFQREVNKTTGITGELLEGLNRIGIRVFGGLGINLGVISESFDQGRIAMTEFAEEVATAKLDENINTPLHRTRALLKGITAFSKNLPGLLTDPAVVIGIIASNFKDLNDKTVDFQRLTGKTAPLLDSSLNLKLINSIQYLETLISLSEKFSMNMQGAIPAKILQSATELQNTMGLTVEQAGQLAFISSMTNTSIDNSLDTIVAQVNRYNRLNKTALNHGQIISDIAKLSEETLASFAGQPAQLAKAAAAARRLGAELSTIEGIADNLLNFESSIENELQAQLLTGRSINLAKAREYALTNQLDKVGKEIFDNTISTAEFANMNRIAQEGLAQALGLSRQQLAKIALQRTAEGSMTAKILEDAAGVTREDLKRVKATEALNISIQKLGQAFAVPAEYLARMAEHTWILYGVMGLLGGVTLINLVAKFKQSLGILLGKVGAEKAATKENIKQTTAATQFTTTVAKSLGFMKTQALLAAQTARSYTQAAVAAQTLSPAFPGAAVGRGAKGRFVPMRAAGAGAGKMKGLLAGSSLLGPKGLAIGAILAALAYGVHKITSAKDGVISPEGGLLISGPKGSIQLNKEDSIVAGTNLFNSNNTNSVRELISKVDQLIEVVKQGGNVYLDGSKVGSTLVMGSYKSS